VVVGARSKTRRNHDQNQTNKGEDSMLRANESRASMIREEEEKEVK